MWTLDGQQHVFYRGTENTIYQVFYDPAFNGAGAVGTYGVHDPEPWASGAVSDPATLWRPTDGSQYMFYRDKSGDIWGVYYDPITKTRQSFRWV